jgi:beta-mannanase
MAALNTDESAIGKRAGIVMWYEHWFFNYGGTVYSWPCTPSYFSNILQHGAIPMLSWSDDIAGDATPFPNSNFNNNTVIAQLADTTTADYQEVLSYAKCLAAVPGPVYLRFDYEMNGNRSQDSPGLNGNAADGSSFRTLWQKVHDIFVAQHATNVKWVWAPNVEYTGSTHLCDPGPAPLPAGQANVYPGDAYVDWMGVDGYNWGKQLSQPDKTWQTLTQVFSPTISHESECSTKPLMISEVSSVEAVATCDPEDVSAHDSKAAWIINGLASELPTAFPEVRAVVWFSQQNDACHDFRFNSSTASQEAFALAIGANPYYSGAPVVP